MDYELSKPDLTKKTFDLGFSHQIQEHPKNTFLRLIINKDPSIQMFKIMCRLGG